MFLTLMVVGLVGLFLMAMPALGRHGHAHGAHAAHGGRPVFGRGGGTPRLAGRAGGGGTAVLASKAGAAASAASAHREVVSDGPPHLLLRLMPSPRAICSVLALYGAFGNALLHAGHMGFPAAALLAAVPALLVEYLVVRPVWNLLFRFQGQPSSPFDALLLSEAQAVIPFRNGRGMVSVVRDGRVVQLAATLREDHAALPVKVGDRLRIEDVDARRERVTVSLVEYKQEP
ncbi:MAG TPA: hypothetical protein VGG39_34215 [Polyangiaceae bacterium]